MKTAMIISLCLLTGVSGFAQHSPNRARYEALKVSYISRQLELTSGEAQEFWPVYNAFEKDLKALKQSREQQLEQGRVRYTELSDKEVEEMLLQLMSLERRELEIRQSYLDSFKEVIPVKKVGQLYHMEGQFRKWMVEQMQERAGERQGRHGR